NEWAGLLTAVAYTVAPFHMVNVYVRGDSLAEFWAMALYPWLILLVLKIGTTPSAGITYPLLALLYAGLILSHNISALIFSPFLLLAILLFIMRKDKGQRAGTELVEVTKRSTLRSLVTNLLPVAASLLLALGLAAWFFLPALVEQSLAQLGPVTEGYFHYSNHFLSSDLVQTSIFFDYGVDGGNAFRMGLVQAVTALGGLAALGWVVLKANLTGFKNLSGLGKRILFVAIGLIVATLMLTPLSRFLWDHLLLLPFTQFPWRFLSVQALFTALLTGAVALLPWRQWLVPALCLLLVVGGLGRLQTDHLYLTEADITAESLAHYEWFSGNIGTTVSAEYLPHTVQPRPVTSSWLETGRRHSPQIMAGTVSEAAVVEWQTARQQWRVTVDSPAATLVLPTLHWPGWQAAANGEGVEIRPSPGTGLIMLDLPQGSHELRLALTRTPVRQGAEWISLLSLLLWLVWLRPWGGLRRWRRPFLGALVVLFLLSAGLHSWPQRPLSAGTQSWDFAQLGYLHHTPGGIPFSNGAILHRYTYSHDQLTSGERFSGGERLTISLELTAAPGTPVTMGLATPAHPRPQPGGVTAPLALTQTGLDQAEFHFDLPPTLPAGLYMPYLQVGEGVALTPGSNQERGGLYLRPLRITALPADPAPPRLDLVAEEAHLSSTPSPSAVHRSSSLELHLRYTTTVPLGPNYNLSLRLSDEEGHLWQQYDLQPGHGFRPSSLWPPRQWVNDRVAFPLPDLAAEDGPFFLMVRLYEVAGGEVIATRRLGQLVDEGRGLEFVARQPQFADLPPELVAQTAVFADETGALIALRGFEWVEQEEELSITLYWEALAEGRLDYTRFVHVLPLEGGAPLVQDDAMPQQGTYPTGQWQRGERLADPVQLSLAGLPPGRYRLMVGFYRHEADGRFPRLAAYDAAGDPFPDAAVPLPDWTR
ncbi:MAG: hypothetical protein R6X32_03560, partial [Chloroflexota bacterium]